MITANLSDSYYQVLAEFKALPVKKDLALKRAVRKVSIWLQRQAFSAIGKASGISQKNLKKFQRVNISVGPYQGQLWLGLNPMPLHLAGRVSWSKSSSGARVRGKTHTGAFHRAVYGAERKVWVRTARNATAGLTPYHEARRYRPASGINRGRFPVTLVGVPLQDNASLLSDELMRRLNERFAKVLAQEINYLLVKNQ